MNHRPIALETAFWLVVCGAPFACMPERTYTSEELRRMTENRQAAAQGPSSAAPSGQGGAVAPKASLPPVDPSLSALPFPAMPKDLAGLDTIKVKVFPHLAGDPWKGGKEVIDTVTIAGDCKGYGGNKTKVASTKKTMIAQRASWPLVATKLKAPLWLECAGGATVQRNAPLISHRYAGNFYVSRQTAPDGRAYVEVINVVPMETYLRGVVPSEVIPSWPAETLKAQAVAARTYAYFNVAHNMNAAAPRLFDVDDTAFFQAYNGLTSVTAATDKAIADTNGLVMNFGGRVILTFFHTDAAGHTESAREVFNLNAPYCSARPEAHDLAKTKPTLWSKVVAPAELSQKLAAAGHIPAGRQVKSWQVAASDRTNSKRVRTVTLTLDDGRNVRIATPDIKSAVGGMKSSLFDLSADAKGLTIEGRGAGHGVGMSQKGANELVKQKGWDHKRVLTFYYQGASLCALTKRNDTPSCAVGMALRDEERPHIALRDELL